MKKDSMKTILRTTGLGLISLSWIYILIQAILAGWQFSPFGFFT